MKISSATNVLNIFRTNKLNNKTKSDKVSFGSIYIDDAADIGRCAESRFPPKFNDADALLLNEVSQMYPNQDCFIRNGAYDYPRLEFREKPIDVQLFSASALENYKIEIDPSDSKYPCIELLLSKEESDSNKFIGVQNHLTSIPSLAFTICAGFELHKKLLEKKYEILEYVGTGDKFDLGEKSIDEKAHAEIRDIEIAVKRYLLELAFATILDRTSNTEQVFMSKLFKIKSKLTEHRNFDLTNSIENKPVMTSEELFEKRINICELATSTYPNTEENIDRIKKLEKVLLDKYYGMY